MNVFIPTLSKMGYLFCFIVLGYVLKKIKVLPDNTATVLGKLENNAFIPALAFSTFATGVTLDELASSWQFLVGGIAVIAIAIPIGLIASRFFSKDDYVRKIYAYGLCFANFGFMGNAIVEGVYGKETLASYLILTTPISIAMYSWGFPALLIPSNEEKPSMASRLKSLLSPQFICMLAGIIICFAESASALGGCMSPVAMLITGMTIAEIDIKKALGTVPVYILTVIRLLVMPIAFMVALILLKIPTDVAMLMVCAVAMPLGMNSIVVPKAYGKDSTVASGMVLISHVLACLTIPFIFMLFNILVK